MAIQPCHQAAQRRISRHFVPVIEAAGAPVLALDGRKRRAQDGRHPEQYRQAAGKTDAAKRGEDGKYDDSQAEARDDLDRFPGVRQTHVRWREQAVAPYEKFSQQSGA